MSQLPGSAGSYSDVVDLARYPIDDLDSSRGRALVDACRGDLATNGACTLEGFLLPDAIDAMVGVALSVADQAWVSNQTHTVYFEAPDDSVTAAHPKAHLVRSAKRGIAYDYIPEAAPVRRLYESDDMTRFVAAVLGKEVLYRSADVLDGFQITFFEPGDELGWHFDRSEFSVTVMYQPAASGGHFDYVPALRSDEEENFEGVEQVLRNDGAEALRLPGPPGTLALFQGHHALHRVTPVKGPKPRINSVLTYGEHPGMRLNDLTSLLFYGRTSPR